MSVLIANLGTSDLTVQVGDFFFPISHRDYSNVDTSELSQEEQEAWEKAQRDFFISGLASELGILQENYTFREISRKLLENYKNNPELWHHRIRPGRIWGAIQKSLDFQVKQVYLFVTNQPESEEKGYPTDTIHVFEILQMWLAQEGLNLELIKQEIPPGISPVKDDQLFEYYCDFFVRITSRITNDSVILLSTKGGTAQMQQALRNQTLASGINKILFIDLKDNPQRTLHGQPSEATFSAFWKYIKIQKINIIKKLLERWDFDGASLIVNEWKDTLEFLENNGIEGVSNSLENSKKISLALAMGVHFLNLDNKMASKLSGQLGDLTNLASNYDVSLNIYTQSRIFEELSQYANLLLRLATFVELCQAKIMKKLGHSYFSSFDNLELDFSRIDEVIRQKFYKIESDNNRQFRESDFRDRYKLTNRYSQRNFIQAMIEFHNIEVEKNNWCKLQKIIESLEFWIKRRNSLAHNPTGVSLETMNTELEQEKRQKDDKAINACSPDKIVSEMAKVFNLTSDLLNQQSSKYTSPNSEYYIYSEIKKWVLEQI